MYTPHIALPSSVLAIVLCYFLISPTAAVLTRLNEEDFPVTFSQYNDCGLW